MLNENAPSLPKVVKNADTNVHKSRKYMQEMEAV